MDFEPEDALALTRDARARMAAHARTPIWYAPLYGLGTGGVITSLALPPLQSIAGVTVSLLLVLCIYAQWQRISGLRVNGYRRGRTLPVTLALVVVLCALATAAVVLKGRYGIVWAPIACGIAAGIAAAAASVLFDRVWRAKMRGE